MSRLPQVNARQLVRALQSLGFQLIRQKGSHAFFRHPTSGRVTVVPIHGREDIDRGLLFEILLECGISAEDFLLHL